MAETAQGRWRTRIGWAVTAVALLAPLAFTVPASAASLAAVPGNPADLDVSFGGPFTDASPGTTGTHFDVKGAMGDTLKQILVQPDGKTIAIGHNRGIIGDRDLLIARFNRDGTSDVTFSDDGHVRFTQDEFGRHGAVGEGFTAGALQLDGKVLVAFDPGQGSGGGPDSYANFLQRYNSNGSLDSTFGVNGTIEVPGGCQEYGVTNYGGAHVINPLADGKIEVLTQSDPVCAGFLRRTRLNVDGSLDSSYGGGSGFVALETPSVCCNMRFLTVQPDGKILAVSNSAACCVSGYTRWNVDGTIDTTFAGGRLEPEPEATDYIPAHPVLQSDGKYVLGAHDGLRRYNSDGTLDPSFMTVAGALGGVIAIQPDDKIVYLGGSGFARYNADGSPDTSFGSGGIVPMPNVDTNDLDPTAVAISPDGRIVIGGRAVFEGVLSFALARYMGDIKTVLCPGKSVASVFIGTSTTDTVTGTAGRDLILGEAGADTLSGSGGNDCIYGGPGKDAITGGAGKDRIFINAGDVKAGKAETIAGGTEDDTLVLGAGIGTATVFGSPPNFSVLDPLTSGVYAVSGVELIVDTP